MPKKITDKIFGQSSLLGKWWGNLQTIAQHTNIYIQFMILSFSATSAYTVVSSSLHGWGYQLPFWQFVVGILLVLVVMGLFSWRLSIPSTFATWNEQWWNHGNHLKDRLDKRDKEIDERLDKIEKILIEINSKGKYDNEHK